MDITREFAMYIQKNNIEITFSNYDSEIKKFKEKLVSECEQMELCYHNFKIGDYVKVEIGGNNYRSGSTIEGKIVKFYPYVPQARLDIGRSFFNEDKILIHKSMCT